MIDTTKKSYAEHQHIKRTIQRTATHFGFTNFHDKTMVINVQKILINMNYDDDYFFSYFGNS